jgi:chloramphenicol 3-O phosphotransferase
MEWSASSLTEPRQNDDGHEFRSAPARAGHLPQRDIQLGQVEHRRELLLVLERPFFHLSIDAVNAMRARERTLELDPGELAAVLARTRAGFHRAIAGMAQAGNDLVVDYILSEQWRLLDCLTVLSGLDIIFVGVRCPDTSTASPCDCALAIKQSLNRLPLPRAFDRPRSTPLD